MSKKIYSEKPSQMAWKLLSEINNEYISEESFLIASEYSRKELKRKSLVVTSNVLSALEQDLSTLSMLNSYIFWVGVDNYIRTL